MAVSRDLDEIVKVAEPAPLSAVRRGHLTLIGSEQPQEAGASFVSTHFAKYELERLAENPTDPMRALRAVMALLAAGSPEEAVAVASKVTHHNDYWLRHYHANALARLHRWDEAEIILRALVAVYPEDHRPLHALGKLFMAWNRRTDALKVLKEASTKRDADAATFNDYGVVQLGLGDAERALGVLRQSLARDQFYTPALNNTAVCYQVLGRSKQAYRFYLAALHVDSSCAPAVHNIAETYIARGDFAAAQNLLEQHRASNRGDTRALERLAWVNGLMGFPDRAIELLKEGVALTEGKDVSLLNNLGIALSAKSRYEDAQRIFRKAIAQDPSAWLVRYNYACTAASQQNWRRVVELLPDPAEIAHNVDAILLRCNALIHLEEYASSVTELEQALKQFPGDARIVNWTGFVRVSYLDDLTGAIAILETGLNEHPQELGIANNLAYALIKAGRVAEARSILEPHRTAIESARGVSAGVLLILRATWGLIRIREGAFDEGMRFYGLARSAARGRIEERLAQKMLVERGRHALDHGQRADAVKHLSKAIRDFHDVEFQREAEELLSLCRPAGSA